jgi:Protein of unknown function (DUF3485)
MTRKLVQPAFVLVAGILLLAAVGLNGATQFLQLHFRKLPVPLARELTELPDRLGPWVQVSVDTPVDHDVQETLGTNKYVFRDYADTRVVTADELAQFKDKSPGQCHELATQLEVRKPGSVINLALTYYTGLVDTVAHVPERCFTADGYEPTHADTVTWDALKGRPGDHTLRFIVFEDTNQMRQSIARNVAYVFNCNGEYMSDSIGVRRTLAALRERYGYYMKIEMHTLKATPQEASRAMNDLLASSLPEIERCLPDWQKLKSSPPPAAAAAAK